MNSNSSSSDSEDLFEVFPSSTKKMKKSSSSHKTQEVKPSKYSSNTKSKSTSKISTKSNKHSSCTSKSSSSLFNDKNSPENPKINVSKSEKLVDAENIANKAKPTESNEINSPKSNSNSVNNSDEYSSLSEIELKEGELAQIQFELQDISGKIRKLQNLKTQLQLRQSKISDDLMMLKSKKVSTKDWSTTDFEWSDRMNITLKEVFKIDNFRPLQVSAINATMSKQDLIMVMPTGGGKSLCYQLPALLTEGTTIVVCPLVALMEDQVMQLKRLGINAAMVSASTPFAEYKNLVKSFKDPNCPNNLKLLYVSPEKLAKNKTLLSGIQQAYRNNKIARLAIDEVHCCSDWGHDFRPDYNFLGVFRDMLSDIPVIGLTATASDKVIADVQKILNIQGCLILKAPFNRSNLFYEVRPKPKEQAEWLIEVEDLLKTKFSNQSGIIYAFSIKDTEDIAAKLGSNNLKVWPYHASMTPEDRSKAYSLWMSGKVKIIVATTAFGLGIDKPDVRFVIHHCMSKTMENYYQESGRAGRDGKPASCVLYYRFSDYFRLSTLVFTATTGLQKLLGMLLYCVEPTKCRRLLIAEHFSDNWQSTECNATCDHCLSPRREETTDITQHCKSMYKLIDNAGNNDTRLTSTMLLDLWYGKGKANLRLKDVPIPKSSRTYAEKVLAHLLISKYLKEDMSFTAYSTFSYFKIDPSGRPRLDGGAKILMPIAGGVSEKLKEGKRVSKDEGRSTSKKVKCSKEEIIIDYD